MRALTVWQPWATLIAVGGKRFEWRRWDYRSRNRDVEGERIAIHAGARPMVLAEVHDIITRIRTGDSDLDPDSAMPLLSRLIDLPRMQMRTSLPLAAVVATAVIGRPRKATAIFAGKPIADSDRIDQHIWGWPMSDVQQLLPPVPFRGAQGFWHFPSSLLS